MKKMLAFCLTIAAAVSFSACGGYGGSSASTEASKTASTAAEEGSTETDASSSAASEDPYPDLDHYTMKFANWFGEDHPQNQALTKLAADVEEKSGGHLKIELYPNSQLGSEDVYIDSIREGTVEMACHGTMMAEYCPGINVAECPFLFDSWEHAQATLGGEIGQEITKDLPEKGGVRCLAWTANGFRVVSSSKQTQSVEDLVGQRIRIPTTPLYVKTFSALGVNPVSMTLSETYTAMETNVVDGQDNPYATDRASAFYEVQKYILETNHMFSPVEWCINEAYYKNLPDELKEVLSSCVKDAADYEWQLAIESEQEDKKFLQEQGMTVTECTDDMRKQMIDKVTAGGVYDWLYGEYPGTEQLADEIRNYQKS